MSLDTLQFRNALGNFATGVCIVTANPQGFQPVGLTVNSFASVSLQPPLVLWSIQNNSDCWDEFEQADSFAINILAADQQHLSGDYARRGHHQLRNQDFRLGKTGLPIIRGALTSFECRVWQRYPGGDHVILVGEVLHMETHPNKRPLLFSGGQYGQLR